MIDSIMKNIFLNVSRGIFNEHKLIFSLILSVKIKMNLREITNEEWNFLLKDVQLLSKDAKITPSPSDRFTGDSWKRVQWLQNMSKPFTKPLLGEEITQNLDDWLRWIEAEDPNFAIYPINYQELSLWHQILLLKTFRDEKLTFAITNFVRCTLGDIYVTIPPAKIKDAYIDMRNTTPLVVILSKGADPSNDLRRLAIDYGKIDFCDMISLGQG